MKTEDTKIAEEGVGDETHTKRMSVNDVFIRDYQC